jgi:hypothetical protein
MEGFNAIGIGQSDKIHLRDCIAYVEPGQPANINPLYLGNEISNNPGANQNPVKTATNVSGIGAGPKTVGSRWVTSNIRTGTTLSDVYGTESLWQNNGSKGATICKRYVDGQLTTTGLWPWPMNQRIIDAMTLAGYSRVIDVTATMEQLFGSIPSVCRWDAGTGSAAVILTPTPGTALTATPVTFVWSTGVSVTEYWLDVGTTPGGTQIYTASQAMNLSVAVGGIPIDGSVVYVRLHSKISGVWSSNSYTYSTNPPIQPPVNNPPIPAPGPPSLSGHVMVLPIKT